MNYVCEKATVPEKTCDFRSGKMILQQEITPEQITKLLAEGKTDLPTGFVSSRTNRKFKAFLVKQPNGKIGFEFEHRPERSEEHTSELQSLMRTSYAVFCLNKIQYNIQTTPL